MTPARRAVTIVLGAALLAAASAAVRIAAAGAAPRLLVPRTPAVEALAATGRIRVLDRYGPEGGRLLVSGPRDAVEAALAVTPGAPPAREVPSRIHLRGRVIDTSAPRLTSPARSPDGHLEVIQLAGPIKGAWLAALRAGGVRLLSYVPHDAYLAWVEEPDRLETLAPLGWREELGPSDRVDPRLAGREGMIDVTVQVVRAGRHDDTLRAIRARAAAVTSGPYAAGPLTHVRLRLPAEALADLTAMPEVVWIEPFDPPVRHDERATVITSGHVAAGRPQGPGYIAWLAAHDLDDLSGHVVDVSDTGIDTGQADHLHPGLEGRLAYAVDATAEDRLDDCAGHGTNLAGIIAGAPGPGFDLKDPEGFLYGLGMAPSARLGATRLFTCAGNFAPVVSFSELLSEAYARGARIGNNSWGGLGSIYNVHTAEYDALVRDVNLDPADGDQSFLPVFSAGNFGPIVGSVGWPSIAKNVLSVGGTENYRPNVIDGCGAGTLEADNADHVLSVSSRGPTGDGRIKPDIVAPASHAYSLASGASEYSGVGVCDRYHPPGQRLLTWATGTSQAAAHASGAAVLASEILQRRTGTPPSPALIKAALINHAHDMGTSVTNPSNTINRPNGAQGWGRLDTGSLADEPAAAILDQEVVLRETGSSYTIEPIVVEDPSRPVVVTLVWTDAPGTPGGWSWVNDLDLTVRSAGATYLGNVTERGMSVTGGRPDERNNVENVYLPPGQSLIRVDVTASHLAGDGVPSQPGETDQDFALYISNARWPRGEASVSFGARQATCGAALPVRVADGGLRGFGHTSLTLGAGADEETLTLRESPAASGVFSAAMDATGAPALAGDGVLQIAGASVVTATYLERDPATGLPVARTASLPARCGPPVVTQVEVRGIGETEATLSWRTDRPGTSVVSYVVGGGAPVVRSDPRRVTQHEMRLTGLASCTVVSATVSTVDAAGQSGSASPLVFTTAAGGARRRTLFHDEMEELVSRWSHRSLPSRPDTVDDWQLGLPGPGVPRPPRGPHAWGTRLDGNYSVGLDAVLESPEIDLRDAMAPQLSFWHHYAISGGRPPDSRNDGGWVEITTDGGARWSALDPIGGYPDTIDADNPYLAGGSGVYAGATGIWSRAIFDLSLHKGDVVRLRFHVWQDAGENNSLLSGWHIDDVEVTSKGTCHRGEIELDAAEYGCSSRAEVSLWDPDLDRNGSLIESASVSAESPAGQVDLVLRETASGSGEFRGTLQLGQGPDRLPVSAGDSFSVRYDDTRGEDGPAVATAAAVVPECTPPPAPGRVTVSLPRAGALDVSWEPVDPLAAPDLQGYHVHYDSDSSGPVYSGTGAQQGASPVRAEARAVLQTIGALASCTPHYVTVSAFDRLGNESPFAAEVFAMPSASVACAQGQLRLFPVHPGCTQTLSITLTDSNADPDVTTAGRLTVSAASGAQPGGLPVELVESGAATGLYTGLLPLSRAPAAGRLATFTGDEITITYQDAADGSGGARAASATVKTGDCDAPIVSDLRIASRAADRARVIWTTDEPATSRVRFGSDPSLERTVESDPNELATQHEVLLTGLTPCSVVHYDVSSTDAMTNTVTHPGGAVPLRFGTWRDLPLFTDDLESGSPGWTHATLGSAPDEWELGTPVGDPNDPAARPALAHSGTTVWGTDLDSAYEDGADMVLVSPPVDLSSKEAITLSFWHWYDLYTSGAPDGFDDGAFVEISSDGGATWSLIEPVGGYPDRISGTPYVPFSSGAYAGRTGGWVPASFVLDSYGGEVVRLRFHLLEDPATTSVSRHSGWYLDDIRISFAVACHESSLAWDRTAYGCTGEPARLRLMDQDLDTPGTDTAAVSVRSLGEPGGETVLLQESPTADGVFEGEIVLSRNDAPGTLRVLDGDTLTASYDDADDGTGAPAVTQSSASVGDCLPPVLEDVRVTETTVSSFQVRWHTAEPADSRLLYGADSSYGSVVSSPALTRDHELRVDGLASCGTYVFTAASADALGNLARDDTASGPRLVSLPSGADVVREGFDGAPPGWTHTGQQGSWSFADGLARSDPGTALRPAHANTGIILTSPGFDLTGVVGPSLTIRHAYAFPTSFLGGDGGWVEGWDGHRWIVLQPDGGYPAWIDPEASREGQRHRGFAGTSAGFVSSRFDLSPLARPGSLFARVRLRVFVDDGPTAAGSGWEVDEVVVRAELSCREGHVGFDPLPVTCADSAAGLLLHDLDLDRDPGAPDSATMTVTSTGGGPEAIVTLTESAGSPGVLRGVAPLDAGDTGVAPRARAGDRLTVSYQDADDGTGSAAVRTHEIVVRECDAPVLRALRASPVSGGAAMVAWLTDQPSTSDVTLSPAAGPPLEAGDAALVTSHRVTVHGLDVCGAYAVTARSRNADGVIGRSAPPPDAPIAEAITRDVLFSDDMEGADPGWVVSGPVTEWERGVPTLGPPGAVSGTGVYATDLDGFYNSATDAILTSPPIDLRGVTSARLTFWHWYDIFGNDTPNSFDDAGWAEVLPEGSNLPIYIEPVGGYPDATDEEGGRPLPLGRPVYAGQSEDWERAAFDLSPFAGKVIRLRFRLWNDVVELLVNGRTGAGWYLDDVEVSAPRFCHTAPAITAVSIVSLPQGGSAAGVQVDGSGFRPGAQLSLGSAVTLSPVTVTPTRLTFDAAAAARAPLGPRDLTVVLPDGQAAMRPDAVSVVFSPARADLDGSGRVDASDLAKLAAVFAALEGESRFDAGADLNGDGAVDGLDLALLASVYGRLIE